MQEEQESFYKDCLRKSILSMQERIKTLPPGSDRAGRIRGHIVYCQAVIDDKLLRPFEQRRVINTIVSTHIDNEPGDFL